MRLLRFPRQRQGEARRTPVSSVVTKQTGRDKVDAVAAAEHATNGYTPATSAAANAAKTAASADIQGLQEQRQRRLQLHCHLGGSSAAAVAAATLAAAPVTAACCSGPAHAQCLAVQPTATSAEPPPAAFLLLQILQAASWSAPAASEAATCRPCPHAEPHQQQRQQ